MASGNTCSIVGARSLRQKMQRMDKALWSRMSEDLDCITSRDHDARIYGQCPLRISGRLGSLLLERPLLALSSRTGTGGEGQQSVGYDPFARSPESDRSLRNSTLHWINRKVRTGSVAAVGPPAQPAAKCRILTLSSVSLLFAVVSNVQKRGGSPASPKLLLAVTNPCGKSESMTPLPSREPFLDVSGGALKRACLATGRRHGDSRLGG